MAMNKERMQQLALAAALQKVLREQLDSRKPGTLYGDAATFLANKYDEDRTDRLRLQINGVNVGTLSCTFSKPVEEDVIAVDDYDSFLFWLFETEEGRDTLASVIKPNPDVFCDAAKDLGFMPDGCHVEHVQVPAMRKGQTLRVDPVKVAQAYGAGLPGAVAGLIGGASE